MVNVPVIAKRELSSYFLSPIAYLVLTGFALANGIWFSLILTPNLPNVDAAAAGVFSVPVWLLIFAIPLLTMRLLSEEAARGTLETLMTTPVTEAEVVVGKYLGVLMFSLVLLTPVLGAAVYLRIITEPDLGRSLAGLLGLFLLTAQFLSIGLFWSALTRIQVGSAILTFSTLFGVTLLPMLWRNSFAAPARALRYVSPLGHYDDFLRGVVDTGHLAYYVITTALFLFLTVKALELRKWR